MTLVKSPKGHQSLQRPMRLASVCLLLMVGCGTWLGNPKDPDKDKTKGSSSVTLAVQGAKPQALALANTSIEVIGKEGASIGTLTLSEARLALKEIKLKLDQDDLDERDEFKGPYIANLLTNSLLPDPGTISLVAGSYRDIELKLAKLERDDATGVVSATDPLIDRSIYLVGTFKRLDGSTANITIDFDLDEEFSLGRAGSTYAGIEIVENTTNPVVIAFQMAKWFDFTGEDEDLADLTGTTIILTKDADEPGKKLREIIKDKIKDSAEFGKDEDNDGELSHEESNDDND